MDGRFNVFSENNPLMREGRKPLSVSIGTDSTDAEKKEKGALFCCSPTSYADVETIINALKENKSALVRLDKVKKEVAVRIIDMLAGAIFALGGGVCEIEKNVFMFSPNGVEVYK